MVQPLHLWIIHDTANIELGVMTNLNHITALHSELETRRRC